MSAEVREGQEKGGARAHDDARLAARDRAPDALALPLGEAGMPFGRPPAEAGREPVEELGRQRNFRQEHERLPALPKRLGDGLEIDFRLARSGHAFEQRRGEGALRDAGGEIARRGALVGIERARAEVRIERGGDGFRRQFDAGERPLRDEAVDDADRALRLFGEVGLGERTRRLDERGEDAGARFRHPRGRASRRDDAEFRRRRRGDLVGADRHAQHHAPRRQRPARHPVDEIAERLSQRRPVADLGDALQIVAAALPQRPDDAGRLPRPERDADHGSGFERHARHDAIAVGDIDRDRDQHVRDTSHRPADG